ncbi:MAG: phosphoenolpyruvate synthase [Pseudonocardiaceae bacterium]|nr:phosphoenolpyruvate synthase [Pseudonocardiaceae bacterium]
MSAPGVAGTGQPVEPGTGGLVLPFEEIDAGMLALVGGKAANLGELVAAGFPVPPGRCVTTEAYALVAAEAGLERIFDALADVSPGDSKLAEYAAVARERLLAASVPDEVADAVIAGYEQLGDRVPVAVRSSATAEDLPFASFAGQQDTYLGVIGSEALLDAVRRCWASLWTDRAVSYRASNGIDHRTVRLAVVVQRMVEARVAGVMFTANPVTGRRRQAVIDASPGLGEAVVSGAVNPDHFVVDPPTGEVLERSLGDKRLLVRSTPGGGTERVELPDATAAPACVDDRELATLAALGARVEDHYGSPQDTEWAIDAEGACWLTQARPITTLYPLPDGAPASDEGLRVYFSVNVAQGVFGPLTPAGIAAFRMVGASGATTFGLAPARPTDGPAVMVAAGHRLFLDATTAVRSTVGHRLLPIFLGIMEARSERVIRRLFDDPRLSITRSVWPLLRRVVPVLLRHRTPLRAAATLLRPSTARRRLAHMQQRIRAVTAVPADSQASTRLDAVENALGTVFGPAIPGVLMPILLPYLALLGLSRKLLGDQATEQELQTVLRGLVHNPTTEMDLALWRVTTDIGGDPAARPLFLQTTPQQLADMYHAGTLPPVAQRSLAGFLRSYGHRAVAEIDVGVARWAEDPTHVLGAVANYLRLDDPRLAPDAKFAQGRREGEAMAAELTRRARARGGLRGRLVGFCLRRIREIGGLRETPKFNLVLLLAAVREQLRRVGVELAAQGRLAAADDVFFVDTVEAREGLAGRDLRGVVRDRRVSYQQETRRRHVPRVLLSDGTEPEAAHPAATLADGMLVGTAASPGLVSAPARLVLDPSGARLEPGEILVAPSTDPGWTPLFLTAGGLVMEMGGAMSHGAVVAREYGIPAVVGVAHATERIETGQQVTVDGSSGAVTTTERDVSRTP